jgi:hypothetical protein
LLEGTNLVENSDKDELVKNQHSGEVEHNIDIDEAVKVINNVCE